MAKFGRMICIIAAVCMFTAVCAPARTYAASLPMSSLSGLKDTGGVAKAEEKLGFVSSDAGFSKEGWSENYTTEDFKYLACVIYCETEPLGYEARVALGNIVMNRVYSTTDWGHVNTIKDVIYDTKWCRQFDCTAPKKVLGGDSMMDRAFLIFDAVLNDDASAYKDWQVKGMTECIEAAKDVMCGKKTVPDTFVYCRGGKYIETDKASCIATGRCYRIIESHIYYEN